MCSNVEMVALDAWNERRIKFALEESGCGREFNGNVAIYGLRMCSRCRFMVRLSNPLMRGVNAYVIEHACANRATPGGSQFL
jgi:hypothetical protein